MKKIKNWAIFAILILNFYGLVKLNSKVHSNRLVENCRAHHIHKTMIYFASQNSLTNTISDKAYKMGERACLKMWSIDD